MNEKTELLRVVRLVASVQPAPGHGYDLDAMDEAIIAAREVLAASPSSKSTKEAPDLWITFDSQGPYDLRESEEQAQRFCVHYNKREADPLKPYTYRRYVASSSIKEDGPPFARGSWQHAVDDFLVGYMRTSQDFATPHEAVAWLVKITGDAALACHGIATDGASIKEDGDQAIYNSMAARYQRDRLKEDGERAEQAGYVVSQVCPVCAGAGLSSPPSPLGDTPEQQEQKR